MNNLAVVSLHAFFFFGWFGSQTWSGGIATLAIVHAPSHVGAVFTAVAQAAAVLGVGLAHDFLLWLKVARVHVAGPAAVAPCRVLHLALDRVHLLAVTLEEADEDSFFFTPGHRRDHSVAGMAARHGVPASDPLVPEPVDVPLVLARAVLALELPEVGVALVHSAVLGHYLCGVGIGAGL